MRMQVLAAAVISACAGVAWAEEDRIPSLTIGDKAPALDIEHWVRGEKVSGFEKGKVYVVEFWATWCGPCKASMPHISEMQEKYKDYGVTFVGVSDEKLDDVTKFLDTDEWKQKARYTLATDPDASTHEAYMAAAAQGGIPTAFIVGKDSTVQWIGHPMDLDKTEAGEPLDKVVHDTWDAAAFRASWEKEMAPTFERARKALPFQKARKNKDWPTLLKLYEGRIDEEPKNVNVKIAKFKLLVGQMGESSKGYAWGRELLSDSALNAMHFNDLAWYVVDNEEVKSRDLGFALDAATKANELSKDSDPAILDTLARVYWEQGDKAKAVETQKKAVDKAPAPMAEELKKAIEKYQAG